MMMIRSSIVYTYDSSHKTSKVILIGLVASASLVSINRLWARTRYLVEILLRSPCDVVEISKSDRFLYSLTKCSYQLVCVCNQSDYHCLCRCWRIIGSMCRLPSQKQYRKYSARVPFWFLPTSKIQKKVYLSFFPAKTVQKLASALLLQ